MEREEGVQLADGDAPRRAALGERLVEREEDPDEHPARLQQLPRDAVVFEAARRLDGAEASIFQQVVELPVQLLGQVKDILLEDRHLSARRQRVAARREHRRLGEVGGGDGEAGLCGRNCVPARATADAAKSPPTGGAPGWGRG